MDRRVLFSSRSQRARDWLYRLFGLAFIFSLSLNAYFLFWSEVPPELEIAPPVGKLVDGVTVSDGKSVENEVSAAEAQEPDSKAEEAQPSEMKGVADSAGEIVDPETGLRLLNVEIKGSIAQTLGKVMGRDLGDLLSAYIARVYMWKVDMRSDIRRGDRLDVIYRVLPDQNLVDLRAARYHSNKMRKSYESYWYQPADRRYGSYFDENGVEIPATFKVSPIEDYEQITSLLRDGRRHQGIDFKTDVGTRVVTPFRGLVKRINWNSANGNCIEIAYTDSKLTAKFLHMDKIASGVRPGKEVAAGQYIGDSGNTGRSTAPHLHYQLEKGRHKIIDPLDFHDTINRKLPAESVADFERVRDRWRKFFNSPS